MVFCRMFRDVDILSETSVLGMIGLRICNVAIYTEVDVLAQNYTLTCLYYKDLKLII
jgi:hypothetical protein